MRRKSEPFCMNLAMSSAEGWVSPLVFMSLSQKTASKAKYVSSGRSYPSRLTRGHLFIGQEIAAKLEIISVIFGAT